MGNDNLRVHGIVNDSTPNSFIAHRFLLQLIVSQHTPPLFAERNAADSSAKEWESPGYRHSESTHPCQKCPAQPGLSDITRSMVPLGLPFNRSLKYFIIGPFGSYHSTFECLRMQVVRKDAQVQKDK
jgi:hypothetical protein